MATFEELKSSHDVEISSDRNFGIVFTVFFCVIALLPSLKGHVPRLWAFVPAVLFLILAFVKPSLLHPLNVIWFKFGILLGKITTPIVLGILFYLIITPIGFLMRLFGKDSLRLKWDEKAPTYWQERAPGPAPDTMAQQF